MMGFWRRLRSAGAGAFPAPDPGECVSIIGDIHGCDDLLARLLPRLGGRVVCVGDLIDRGEQSAAVLDRLIARPEVLCLRGNHEDMVLGFLDDPDGKGARWLRHGGLQTLASFGVGVGGDLAPGRLGHLRDRLARAMGDERIDWLRGLPLWWQAGNLAVTHAGADPLRPLDGQEARDLVWGTPAFHRVARSDGIWVAHGHVIVDEPAAALGRIAVDTGAYATGRLSAAVVAPDGLRFETA